MPAYDRPIEYRFDPKPRGNDSIAAVIEFNCGPEEMERVKAFLQTLRDRDIIRSASIKAYDSTVATPVLYFP